MYHTNRAFRARWLAGSEVNSKYYSPPSGRWDKMAWRVKFSTIVRDMERNTPIIKSNYAVYTKTMRWNIHLYSPPLRWLVLNYCCNIQEYRSFKFSLNSNLKYLFNTTLSSLKTCQFQPKTDPHSGDHDETKQTNKQTNTNNITHTNLALLCFSMSLIISLPTWR